ncbi:MAG TPA: hypothetical protein VHS06_00735 [Chloroflexota bacterium]|nr:hypothetical protein [Chloroflexota bacterium]
MTVDVLLSGRLKIDGYGEGHPTNPDGSFRLSMEEGCTVQKVVHDMGVPPERVAMTMVNGRRTGNGRNLMSGDRVILIPADVACLWRALGRQNMGMESVFDF